MQSIYEIFSGPWPWYVVGPLMGATIPILLFWGNRMLGVSSALRRLLASLPTRLDYFRYDRKEDQWTLYFALGIVLGAGLTYHFMHQGDALEIACATQEDLLQLGLKDLRGLLPAEVFGWEELWSFRGLLFSLGGGFLVGFGVRYAGGCTSGHGFMGLSMMSLSSVLAVLAFFAGGALFTHFVLPLFF